MANLAGILGEYNWASCQRDCYFVCLLRRDSPSRREIAKTILDNYSSDDYRISYRSYLSKPEYDPVIQRDVPLLLDTVSAHHGYDGFPKGGILQCVINLIAETSIQDDAGDQCWGSMFITEKTATPILLNKIFLVASNVGFHNNLEQLGFQLYTELFDYSFDAEPDIVVRYEKIAKNVKRYVGLTPIELTQHYNKVAHKVIHNRKLAIKYSTLVPKEIIELYLMVKKNNIDYTGPLNKII
jgi:hypothetical protein